MKKLIYLCMTALLTLTFACKKKEEAKHITIGYVDGWAEGVAMTHLANEILTQEGYSVKLEKAAVDLIFASLANGDTDIFMDVWLPVTHKAKVEKFAGKIDSIGVNYEGAKIGLVVPAYVSINSIEELNANKDKFGGQIIGIEKGAGLTAKTDLAVKEYGLKLKQLNSSSVAMLTELKKAIDANQWIVVAGWAPHWKFGRFHLKFLEDPKGVFGASERIETYSRKNFSSDDAFATNFFSHFSLTKDQMADLLAKMNDSDDKNATAKEWVKEHQDLVKSWLSK